MKYIRMQINTKFSRTEEVSHAISHLAGAMLATAGLVLMIHQTSLRGSPIHIISTAIFGATMIILYLSSTMTHILPVSRAKDLFFNLDRIAIYFLIAGTYTPLALIVLDGPLGWVILGIEWGLALVGTFLILGRPGNFNSGVNSYYVISYAVMGWLVLVAIEPVINNLPFMGWFWILLGGVCYTLGILFFKVLKFPFHHLVWHLLVVAGSICHFFSVFFYMIPD